MRQSSVILHECRSISGITFGNDLSSVFKVIPSFKEASLHSLANAPLVGDHGTPWSPIEIGRNPYSYSYSFSSSSS